jgi:hypothetical protein
MAFGFDDLLIWGGLGAEIFGGVQEYKGIEAEAEASEAVLKFNAAQKRRQAERVRKVGAEKEFQLRIELRRMLARNRVSTAAAGVQFAGSPLEAELLNIRDAASSIATLEETTRLESTELETLAGFQLAQAGDVEAAAKISKKGSIYGTIGTIAGTIVGGPIGGAIGKILGGLF